MIHVFEAIAGTNQQHKGSKFMIATVLSLSIVYVPQCVTDCVQCAHHGVYDIYMSFRFPGMIYIHVHVLAYVWDILLTRPLYILVVSYTVYEL